MKKYAIVALVFVSFIACQTAEKKIVLKHSIELKTIVKPVDPVCEMTKDSSWSDFTIYKNDTVWFCSEACKRGFLARPTKYEKNIKK
jgi:YHS domain-containing protein